MNIPIEDPSKGETPVSLEIAGFFIPILGIIVALQSQKKHAKIPVCFRCRYNLFIPDQRIAGMAVLWLLGLAGLVYAVSMGRGWLIAFYAAALIWLLVKMAGRKPPVDHVPFSVTVFKLHDVLVYEIRGHCQQVANELSDKGR